MFTFEPKYISAAEFRCDDMRRVEFEQAVGWKLFHQQSDFQGLGIAKMKALDELGAPVLINAGSIQAFRIVANRQVLLGKPTYASQTEVVNTAAQSLKPGKMSVEGGSFVPTSASDDAVEDTNRCVQDECDPSEGMACSHGAMLGGATDSAAPLSITISIVSTLVLPVKFTSASSWNNPHTA